MTCLVEVLPTIGLIVMLGLTGELAPRVPTPLIKSGMKCLHNDLLMRISRMDM